MKARRERNPAVHQRSWSEGRVKGRDGEAVEVLVAARC